MVARSDETIDEPRWFILLSPPMRRCHQQILRPSLPRSETKMVHGIACKKEQRQRFAGDGFHAFGRRSKHDSQSPQQATALEMCHCTIHGLHKQLLDSRCLFGSERRRNTSEPLRRHHHRHDHHERAGTSRFALDTPEPLTLEEPRGFGFRYFSAGRLCSRVERDENYEGRHR